MKNAYLRIAIFKISRGSMPPDPLEGARASPRRDRYAITSFGVLEFHAPPPPPRDSNPGSATAVLTQKKPKVLSTKRKRVLMLTNTSFLSLEI